LTQPRLIEAIDSHSHTGDQVTFSQNFRESWVRPALFFGNNPVSLVGGAITTSSAMTLIGFWVVSVIGRGGSSNPYVGIIFDLILPALFVFGLLLIPLGMWIRRRDLKAAGLLPSAYPKVDFADPVFRHGIDFVVVATCINFIIVGTASYRGVAYMDTPNFCGQACHVMAPEWRAYHVSPHADVACTDCHVAPGVPGYIHAKLNGTRQLVMVVLHNYPRPIMADDKVPPSSATCVHCHNPDRLIGDKLIVKTSFGDDEKNSVTRTIILLHLGGRDQFGNLAGIHGGHLGHIEYLSNNSTHQTITSIRKTNSDGSVTDFVSADAKGTISGQWRTMDCIDCHNRPAHSFDTPEGALDRAMAAGIPSASLPFVHKQGLALIRADYSSQAEATVKITSGLEEFYRSQYPAVWSSQRAEVEQAEKVLATIYRDNVFPDMKVTWGTHPNNDGHTAALAGGCFRCHDGAHTSKSGATITNDCSICHNLVAVDEPNPRLLAEIGTK
jgi:nitrate/TMAO reductase-like tetraheme cytochrome c subunit